MHAVQKRMYLPELDGLRFFAFLLVFIHHHPLFKGMPYFSFIAHSGWIGVNLFFVLSKKSNPLLKLIQRHRFLIKHSLLETSKTKTQQTASLT